VYFGHLPAGYLAVTTIIKFSKNKIAPVGHLRLLFLVGLTASIAPDLDMFYFYLIDNRQHLHHSYWTHIPFFWLCFCCLWKIFSLLFPRIKFGIYGFIFSINIAIHLLLDSITAEVRWLYPFSQEYAGIFHLPALYKWTVLNFIFHWTFAFEIVLIAAMLYVLRLSFQQSAWEREINKGH
jgi:inner membrane protein